ncbi:hypothetical protein K3495_g10813 [Podosphaera aphanis]|nr:hypothetical protein K3495_g10813 [Podosphaera aphanis]
MIGANLIPNGKTWVAFLKAVPSREIKLQIYEKMKEKGLLSSPTTLQRVVDQLIEINLQSCLFNNQDHNAFIKLMNEKYGPKWLSIEAANKALAVLGKYCLTYRTFEFLDYMESQFQYPDTCSINTILNSCNMKPSPWTVIVELMSAAKFRNLVKPGKETCRILFRLAWKTRSFNMAKLVWRYACLSASTSVGARKQINRSLRRGLSLSGDSVGVGVTWNRVAGFVILGSVSTPHPMELLLPPAQRPLSPSTSLPLRHRVNLPERFAKRIDLDLEISQEWRPSKPFGSMLWQAIERDIEWKKNQFQSQKNLTWLIENSEPLQVSGKSTCNGRILWD